MQVGLRKRECMRTAKIGPDLGSQLNKFNIPLTKPLSAT